MEELTTEQVIKIANGYRSMARALNEFQMMHWPDFTHEQHLDLNAYQNSLLNRAQDLQTNVVRLAFKNTSEMTAGLQQAIDDARSSLQQLPDLLIALTVGAIVVALSSYVAHTNLRGIQSAINELRNLLTTTD